MAKDTVDAWDARFAAIVEMASDAIISVDGDQRIILFNRGAEDIFGWASEEIVGQPLDALLPPRHRSIHREHVDQFGAGPMDARAMARRREVAGVRRNGEEFPAEASLVRTDVNGRATLTVLLRDISHRRQREDRQRFLVEVSEVLFRSLELDQTLEAFGTKAVESLADHCGLYTLAGSEGSRGIQWFHSSTADPELIQLLNGSTRPGATSEIVREIMRSGRPRLIQDVEIGRLPELLPAASPLRRDMGRHGEVEGAPVPDPGTLSLFLLPIRTPSNPMGLAVLIRSARREAFSRELVGLGRELGLRVGMALENARLFRDAQRAIEARDEVLGIVSHDLGNPLQAVFIGLDALQRARTDSTTDGPTTPSETRENYYLNAIRRSAEQMERLIRDLLEVRRMEEGHLVLRKAPRSLRGLVSESLALIEPLARVKSVALVNGIPASQDLEALVDGDRLLQVLSNLVGNAVKHTPREGRVMVSALREAGEIRISVSDQGSGIPPEDLVRIFDRFWRAESTQGRGIGLGLAIARGIVQAHGGRIWAESAVGRGSVFHFSLPCPGI